MAEDFPRTRFMRQTFRLQENGTLLISHHESGKDSLHIQLSQGATRELAMVLIQEMGDMTRLRELEREANRRIREDERAREECKEPPHPPL